MNQWDRIGDPEIKLQSKSSFFNFWKNETKKYFDTKKVHPRNGANTLDFCLQKNEIRFFYFTLYKSWFKGDQRPNLKHEILELLEENTGDNPQDVGITKNF